MVNFGMHEQGFREPAENVSRLQESIVVDSSKEEELKFLRIW